MKLYRHGTMNVPRVLEWVESAWRAYSWARRIVPRLQTYAGREAPNPLSAEISRGEADIKQVMPAVSARIKLNCNRCICGDRVFVTLSFDDSVAEILTAVPRKNLLPLSPLPFLYYI